MFETEVEYRLAKWILAGMLQDGIISDSEMQKAWKKIAENLRLVDRAQGGIQPHD